MQLILFLLVLTCACFVDAAHASAMAEPLTALAALATSATATAGTAGVAGAAAGTGMSLGTAATLASAGLGAAGAIQSGKAQKVAAEANAAEMERAANEARAESSRKMRADREKTDLVLSRQRAVAASSGAGTTGGEGYLDLVGDTAERGEEMALSELYIGEQRARGREGQAAISRWSGNQAVKKSYIDAGSSIVSGVSGMIKGKGSWLDEDSDLRYGRKPGQWRTTTTLS